VAYKSVRLTTDNNSNGEINPLDTVTWTVTYVNTGTVDLANFNVSDALDTGLTFVAPLTITTNTTQSSNAPVVNGAYNGTGNNNFFNAPVTFRASGIITITFQTQVNSGVTGTKENQANGNGVLTDNVDNTTTGFPISITVPSDSIPQTQTAAIEPTTINIVGGGNPEMLLLKRITGVYRQNTPVVTNPNQLFSQFNDNPADPTDDPADWNLNQFPAFDADGNYLGDPPINPENNVYLRGAINGGEVQSGDEIEFTIYFVNKGGADATNVTLCDLVPRNLDFVQNAYGNGQGIAISFDNTQLNLVPNLFYSNTNDGDDGTFFTPSTDTTTTTPECAFNSLQNTDGVVAVDLGIVPNATAQGVPTNSYGFIRFRAKVK
jgi:uncharacterized repeat protein (TIGR01451 family)/fimbrial isopeptide formation D2 family protein